MFGIKLQITKCLDDESYPSFVEGEFIDTHGKTVIIREKDAILTTESLDKNSRYPVEGLAGCIIIERKIIDAREVVKVNTEQPWSIESTEGETIFEVSKDQIVEFVHQT